METIVQLGNRDTDIDPQEQMRKLAAATFQLIDNLCQRWGENFHILDISIHLDEAVVHAHIRSTFSALDKFGYQVPNQSQAFEAMGIQRPDPTAKEGKYNCPLMTFSEVIRQEFYDLCEQQGVVIDREVKNPSQKHLSVLEYKCQQLEAVTVQQTQAIEAAKAEIEEVRAERDTLRDQNSVSRTIQEALKQPDRPIQAEILPARKSISGKIIEEEAVKLSRADYEWLRERATLTTAIRNAWDKLQQYGRQLWAEVDRNARVQAAEQRAELAERQTRADAVTISNLTRRAESAEEQARQQEAYMRAEGIWRKFLELLEVRQRERREAIHHRTR